VALGGNYRFTRSNLDIDQDQLEDPLFAADPQANPNFHDQADLHRFQVWLNWNHACGLFARAESEWFIQNNRDTDDTANQINLFAGWRLARRRVEFTLGCLNVLGSEYHLNPLTPYQEMPRQRVWMGRVRLSF
jgi:hypothetical protein